MAYKPIAMNLSGNGYTPSGANYGSRRALKSTTAAATIASLIAPTAATATTTRNLESMANVPGINIGNTTSPYLPSGAPNVGYWASQDSKKIMDMAKEYGVKVEIDDSERGREYMKQLGKPIFKVTMPGQNNGGNGSNDESHTLRYIVIGGLAAAAVIGIVAATAGGGNKGGDVHGGG
ncbi:hypothetical protein HYX06_06025 [Candidatus Woesearchaeota archaeon]|nr:hypothetical protein [Candidatus Woesearchaeota archaeon]